MHAPNAPAPRPTRPQPPQGPEQKGRRHPVLLFVLVAALAIGAATSMVWVDVIAQAADALALKDPAALLPP